MGEQKVLLITGASSNVGIKLIERIENQYERIIIHYCHNKSQLEKLKELFGQKIVLIQADFTKQEEVEDLIKQMDDLGYIPDHIVHLPAQKVCPQKFHKTQVEQYTVGFDTAVVSIISILRHFLPKMSKQKYGKILFMLTSFTLNTPPKYQAPYITVKYALLGLMKDLAREYAEKGITVNGVSPEMMETKFLSEMPDIVIQKNAEESPLGRNLTVDDVVPTMSYLLSDEADTITGQNIGITGGGS